MDLTPDDAASALAAVAERLRQATGSSRVTIRGPGPSEVGLGSSETSSSETGSSDTRVGTTALLAESLGPGVQSMAGAPQAGITEAPTYIWLRTRREPLLQDDCRQDPLPPAMLTERFGVGAQMLGPLLDEDGNLIGTVSVHQLGGPRHWSAADRAALDDAVSTVQAIRRQI